MNRGQRSGKLRAYEVTITRTVKLKTAVKVTARSVEEAEGLAEVQGTHRELARQDWADAGATADIYKAALLRE